MFIFDHLGNRILATLGSPAAQMARASQLSAHDATRAAFRLLIRAARAGVPAAWYHVGRAYLLGHGVPACPSAALRWLTRAAEADEVEAQTLLASLALQGKCNKSTDGNLFEAAWTVADQQPNYHVALHWAEQAAAHGSAEAQAILGYVLIDGPVELRDPIRGEQNYQVSAEAGCAQGQLGWALILLRRNSLDATLEANELLEKAATAGLPAAQYVLGLIVESGAAGIQDFAAAAEHYRIAAGSGHRSAQLRYGIALLTGRGVEMDSFNGESWLRRAALAGEAAAAMVGDLYVRQGDLPPNYAEAMIWLRCAAEAGHAGAAKMLGHLLLEGAGVAPDPEEAARWLRFAIAGGETEARNDLARLALAGQVPEADRKTVLGWFRERAEAGDLTAAFNLGLCLAEGIGAPRDATQALAWFERAAVAVPVARYWCGRMRAEGRGCEPDAEAARVWFLGAAELHDANAEVAAGEMLFNGRGGAPDRVGAVVLFKRAAATGHPGALYALKCCLEPREAA